MNSTTPIEDFFQRIRGDADPYSFLASLISTDPPTFETEWLDFKGNVEPKGDVLKGTWSRALSGFANTGGGLLVFGIDARKDPSTGIDAAHTLSLVTNPLVLHSRLMELHHQATDPPVIGVDSVPIEGPNGDGFVVCLIPASPFKPHRAEYCKKQYYMRAGDDFVEAGPAMLRTLFYPSYNPDLVVQALLSYILYPTDLAEAHLRSPNGSNYTKLINAPSHSGMSLEVSVRNKGTATASHSMLVIQSEQRLEIYPGQEWRKVANPRGAGFAALRPFHPGEIVSVFSAHFQDRFPSMPIGESGVMAILPQFSPITLRFLLFAEHTQPRSCSATIVREDLIYGQPSILVEAVEDPAQRAETFREGS